MNEMYKIHKISSAKFKLIHKLKKIRLQLKNYETLLMCSGQEKEFLYKYTKM